MLDKIRDLGMPGIHECSPFEGFYAGLYNELSKQYSHDIPWYLERVQSSDTVLDLGCGNGRVAEVVGGRVRHLLAVDSSRAMCEIAAERTAHLDNVRVVLSDMLKLDVDEPADCLILGGLTFSLFTDRDAAVKLIRSLTQLLKPGGRLLFDYVPAAEEENHYATWLFTSSLGSSIRALTWIEVVQDRKARLQIAEMYSEVVDTSIFETNRLMATTKSAIYARNELEELVRECGGLELVEHSASTASGGGVLVQLRKAV